MPRFVYLRALTAPDPFEAVKLAKRKLSETGGEYTQTMFRQDIKAMNAPARCETADGEHLASVPASCVEPPQSQMISLCCLVPMTTHDYLMKTAKGFGETLDNALCRIISFHEKASQDFNSKEAAS